MASVISTPGIGYGCYTLHCSRSNSCRPGTASWVSMSYRRRSRPLSSRSRKRHSKKVPQDHNMLKVNSERNADINTKKQYGTLESLSNFHLEVESDADVNAASVVGNLHRTNFHDPSLAKELVSSGHLQNIQLEVLLSMIKNAEKNIILLNMVRIHALEDLDKIISEKRTLQGQVGILEMKLADGDAQAKTSSLETLCVDVLESQVENLKSEHLEGPSTQKMKDGALHNCNQISSQNSDNCNQMSFSSVHKDVMALKEDNMALKGDIQMLNLRLTKFIETDERVLSLEKELSVFKMSLEVVESKLHEAQEDASELDSIKFECASLQDKVKNLQELLQQVTIQADHTILVLQHYQELHNKIEKLEISLAEVTSYKSLSRNDQLQNGLLKQILDLEGRFTRSDEETHAHIQMYQESLKEIQYELNSLKKEHKKWTRDEPVNDMPWEFWSRILLIIDGWLLEKKISLNDAKLLREMTWKRNDTLRDAYMTCKDKSEHEFISAFLKMTSSDTSPGLHVIHIAAEMAPVAKVGGLADVVCGLTKALQRKGHLIEVILPKYDCMQYEHIQELKVLDVVLESFFDGQQFKNTIWVGIIEGVPVYFIEPHHPARFFWRGCFYGEHDDFKRFSFFSRAALELLLQAGKKPDIIHCHDWQTAFVAPLYWDLYTFKGLNSARICFTCHNFEYQGKAPASELLSCGLDIQQLNRPDRMQDSYDQSSVNPLKGAVVFSNIVTTVSPTYAQEVQTPEGGRGLQESLKYHSKKFVGILNGIDTDAWNPLTDSYLHFHYSADNIEGKTENKERIRKYLKLSISDASQPLVSCITRLVPQKGVHLIRHAAYRIIEMGGQFVLLGTSPISHIQREFEGMAKSFEKHSQVSFMLAYDEALAHGIYAASDMFIVPSLFEPCGLTQMIAMRYGAIPIVRRTGGLNDSVFDIDDNAVPVQFRNGFVFSQPSEQAMDSALERAFNYYTQKPESWKQLAQKVMKIDFSWDSPAAQYGELYKKAVARARSVAAN